ncbi:phosphocholine-specific phospholipase C [Duganella sp. HH101]|uniref:phosphocholine-specific phospholipase C n=1 Tax=Duganella sp. HH101 TaxID=1781066 RepID=UPI000874222B|nr:phospholipase C, phosphocholine-specific [Duganella sp. HH101]OFA03294.1 Non-hemolytic phospholipase C precursor [Duganella sp. HH101]
MKLKTGRRGFLRSAIAGSVYASLPLSIREALAVPAHSVKGSIEDVQHVVILMQENRSFDHYFGTMNGVRGFGDRFTIPVQGNRNIWQQFNGRRTVLPYRLDQQAGNAQCALDLPHTWPDAQEAWDGGRMRFWPRAKTDASMAYYGEQELPFQFALAQAFTVCDAYHCSLQGGTNPNRLFLFSGTNDPASLCGGPAIDNTKDGLGPAEDGFTWVTYAERLEEAGVSWKVYQDMADNYDNNPLVLFRQYRQQYTDGRGVLLEKGLSSTLKGVSVQGLKDDVQAGRLPQVSWIVAPRMYCEHPGPSTPIQGGWYTQQVLEALTSNPEVWSKTVFLHMYDENDAFFDHVPPPAAPALNRDGTRAGKSTLPFNDECHTDGRIYGLGPRVPMLVISPWSKGGWVNSQVFDHTSVLQFLERRFGVRDTNIAPWRRAVCGDLTSCFDFASPDARPPVLDPRSKEWADDLRAEQRRQRGIEVPAADAQSLPVQAGGTRPSRALPYKLNVRAEVRLAAGGVAGRDVVALSFVNSGSAGAVFHVYDQLHLDRLPRRYTVEAGKQLDDVWQPDAKDQGRYDLWILGPNGFHRRLAGNLTATTTGLSAEADSREGNLWLALRNDGSTPCSVTLELNAYRMLPPKTIILQANGGSYLWRQEIANQHYWYDFSATCGDFVRRYAGRLETGAHGVSDPAMGGV